MQFNFLKQFPLLRVAIPLIIGVWLHDYFNGIDISKLFIPVILSFILWLFSSFRFLGDPSYRYRYLPGMIFIIFVFLFGIAWGNLRSTKAIDSKSDAVLKGYVVASLGQTPKSHKYKIVSEVLKADSVVTTEKLSGILYLKKNNSSVKLKPGNVILLKGRLFPFEKPLNPFAFDYSQYLIRERISFRIWAMPEFVKVEKGKPKNSLSIFINRLHERISNIYERSGITGDELALLKAVFMGDRSELVQENKKAFSDAGVMHLLAVSGLHLGIIYMLLIFLLKPLRSDRTKKIKVFVVLIVIWGYALFTGFSSSVFRAAVMFSMVEVGTLLKRSNSVYNQLIASMLIIILVEPYSIYKAGFWLSHAAVAGILAFYPLINNLLTFRFIVFRWLWSLTAVSVAAQFATFPLSIYYFHKFPVYFILGNVLMVPVLAPILLLAFVIAVFTVLPVGISFIKLFSGPLNSLLGYMMDIAGFVGDLPCATLRHLYLSSFELALLVLLVFVLILYRYENRKEAVFIFLISAILLMVSFSYDRFRRGKYSAFVVFSQRSTGVFNDLTFHKNKVFLTDSLNEFELEYICSGWWSKHGATEPDVVVFKDGMPEVKLLRVGKERIMVIHNVRKIFNAGVKPHVDHIVLSGKECPSFEQLKNGIIFESFILSSGLNSWSGRKIKYQARQAGLSYFDVSKQGAWVCSKE